MPAPQVIITPEASTTQLAEAVMEIQRIITRGLGLGDAGAGLTLPVKAAPGTPRLASVVGQPDNVFGSFVEVTLDIETGAGLNDLNVNRVVTHNLNLPVPASRGDRNQRLNVRWMVCGIRYLTNNFADLVATDYRLLVLYANGAVGANSIELRFYTNLPVGAAATVGAITVSLFFFPATR